MPPRARRAVATTFRTPRRTHFPIAPTCARKHPRLTGNRHVNEHITFCALHTKAAAAKRVSPANRAAHQQAAQLHMTQALHHYRELR